MEIGSLWFTQRTLKRIDQITGLCCYFLDGNYLYDNPVVLQLCDDGEIEIVNGHHRITAMWLNGLDEILPGEFEMRYSEKSKGRFWQVKDVKKHFSFFNERAA